MGVTLDLLPLRTSATVAGIAWDSLAPGEARRLQALGLDEGVAVETLHAAPFGRDPLAVRIGRMTVAIRRVHARAVSVLADADESLLAAE